MIILYLYLAIINALGFLLMLIDKQKAKKNAWRIPERVLMAVAAVGGSLGCLCGMYLFRHKTRHIKFSVGLPILFAVQAVLLYIAALTFF